MRNIELKARLRNRGGAEETCAALGASSEGDIRQRDTYFAVARGRLKLRECEPGEDYLVYYERPNEEGSKASEYYTETASRGMGSLLGRALGTLTVVEKARSLWLWENVRIHLDVVEGLGDFIEFEAVLGEGHDSDEGHRHVARLQQAFGLGEGDLIACSYLDLMVSAAKK